MNEPASNSLPPVTSVSAAFGLLSGAIINQDVDGQSLGSAHSKRGRHGGRDGHCTVRGCGAPQERSTRSKHSMTSGHGIAKESSRKTKDDASQVTRGSSSIGHNNGMGEPSTPVSEEPPVSA